MLAKGFKAIKTLARSRSLNFTRDYLAREGRRLPVAPVAVDWWSGDGRPLYYRPGTSDVSTAYDILFRPGRKAEYWLPEKFEPRLILDIGANIGFTARYLAHRFPGATVHAFEPIPDNLALLAQNVAETGVLVHPFGLGTRSGSVEFRIHPAHQWNPGAYSIAREHDSSDIRVRAEVRSVNDALSMIGKGPIDVIKIDVEGAEGEIFRAFPDDVLASTTWIYGELHEVLVDSRSAFGVLERLAAWFDIETHKGLRKRTWFFDACNRNASKKFRSFRRAH